MAQPDDRGSALAAAAALAEPVRRELFVHALSASRFISRDEAAEALGITRSVAAFHLDKLVNVGLLEVEYRRPPGKDGPGAGRPAKLYRVRTHEVAFSVPERHYELAAILLIKAIAEIKARSTTVADALRSTSRAYGRSLGAATFAAREKSDGKSADAGSLERVEAALIPLGYEPRIEEGRLTLENCPFRALVLTHQKVVCRMNHHLLKGLLEGADASDLAARRFDPSLRQCCVRIGAR